VSVHLDNAAGRLHELITTFRRNSGPGTVPQAWAAVLGSPSIEHPDFLRRLAYVFRLPEEIERELDEIDEDEFASDVARRWKGSIAPRLGPALFLGQQSGQVSPGFDDASLTSLEYCSYVLHRYRPQRYISDGEVERIRLLIEELQSEVRGQPNLDPELRKFLSFHITAMQQALLDLAVRGPSALEEALDQAVGATQRRTDLTVKADSNRSVWTKFGNVIIAVAAVLQIATSSLALPSQIRAELEGPSPATPVVVKVIQEAPPQVTHSGEQATDSPRGG
jgi:hypothetical protein